MVRAKFALTQIITTEYAPNYLQKKYIFEARYDDSIPEDQRFQKASPSGRFEIVIDNPAAQAFYDGKIGKSFYFDCVDAPEPAKA